VSRINKLSCLCCVLLLAALQGTALAGDGAAAEHQYRVARRLIAEGAPAAAAAMAKVLALDPEGPLADDALIEQALLLGVARWPEELGRISAPSAAQAITLVRRLVTQFSQSDRAAEARYYLALLLLEPLALHDQAAAKVELIDLTTGVADSEWSRRARYTGAWMSGLRGKHGRARSACERLYVDNPVGQVAARARVGRARLALMDGDHGLAAHLLQAAIDAGVPPEVGAVSLRALAVRNLLNTAGESLRVGANTGIRYISGLAATASGGVLVGDRRNDLVVEFDREGRQAGSWPLKSPQALAVTLPGRIFAAAESSVYALVKDQAPVVVASLGDFAPVSGMTVDDSGRIWVIDKQGSRVGVVAPGALEPTVFYEGSRIAGIVWDGHRLIVLDGRDNVLIAISSDGSAKTIGGAGVQKPVALAADRTGRLAVIDSKAGAVVFLKSDGSPINSIGYRDAGIRSPVYPVFGPDGQLHFIDNASGSWVTVP